MNEEEITERIKDLIHTCDFGIQQHGTYDDLFELDKTALEGILDLYNKEKERNKELEEKLKIATAMLTKGTYSEKNKSDNDFDKQFIAVDKIKEKIENLSISLNDIENSLGMTANKYDTIKELNIKIDVLEELLEEV